MSFKKYIETSVNKIYREELFKEWKADMDKAVYEINLKR